MLKSKDALTQISINYFPKERSLIPEQEIASALDRIENTAIALMVDSFTRAIAKVKKQDLIEKDLDKVQFFLQGNLGNNIYGNWLSGLQLGNQHGDRAIALKTRTARFAKEKQPEPKAGIIRNKPAEKAIKARVNKLAKDVEDSEWRQIKKAILAAIKPSSPTEDPISRRELNSRINDVLGDRVSKFKNRAERIARTELTFAYNTGRLDSYVRSGLVEGVKYQTIMDERRCPICASRQGIIVSLGDANGLGKIAIPAHVMCRCVWSPVLKTEFDKESKAKNRSLKERSLFPINKWLAGAIIASILIPGETVLIGALFFGLVKKTGSSAKARNAIAKIIDQN